MKSLLNNSLVVQRICEVKRVGRMLTSSLELPSQNHTRRIREEPTMTPPTPLAIATPTLQRQ